jgi:hypothetical protein
MPRRDDSYVVSRKEKGIAHSRSNRDLRVPERKVCRSIIVRRPKVVSRETIAISSAEGEKGNTHSRDKVLERVKRSIPLDG